jgi:hypothetical protein
MFHQQRMTTLEELDAEFLAALGSSEMVEGQFQNKDPQTLDAPVLKDLLTRLSLFILVFFVNHTLLLGISRFLTTSFSVKVVPRC